MSKEYFAPLPATDYLLDMVEALGENLGKSVFEVESEITPISIEAMTDKDMLMITLGKMLNINQFNIAEDLLFKFARENTNAINLEFIEWFYSIIDSKSDSVLKNNNFDRNEILTGVSELKDIIAKKST